MKNTFGINIIPDDDKERIRALRRYQILDTPPEGAFNNVAQLATQIFKVPVSLISLVDEDEVFFKANIGMGNAKSTSRGVSLCSLAVLKKEVTVFEDAPTEPCLLTNPNVAGSFGLKFYAGAPLTTRDGFRIGTLCIIDKVPRRFTEEENKILEGLAKIVMDEIELRLSAITETEKLHHSNEELIAINEEMSSINEEMNASNEELLVTQQKLVDTNMSLVKSEASLQLAISSANLGMWNLDFETGNLNVSDNFRDFFGFAQGTLIEPEQVLNAIDPVYQPIAKNAIQEGYSKLKSVDIQYPIVHQTSGKQKWIRGVGKVIADVNGKAKEFIGMNIDVTKQVTSSLSMAESEARLRYLLEDAPVAIAVLKGRELMVESANKRILEIWNKTPDVIGKPLSEALPELEGQDFLRWLDNVYTTGIPFVGNEVKVLLEKNGELEEVYSNFVYHPIKNVEGTSESIMVVATTVTEQVKAKLLLKKSEEDLQTLADNISQLAWMADDKGFVYWYNKRWFDYTGTDLEEMEGWGWRTVHHPDHVERVVEKYNNDIVVKGEVWEDTFPLRSKEGEYRWFLSQAVPFKDSDGKIIRWFGTNTDITKEQELSLQKDDFLGVVSHELKTPITSLKANLQLLDILKNDPTNSLMPKIIESSARSMEKINALVDDLLTMRSFAEGQLRLDKHIFKIRDMLNLCCNHVRLVGKYELIIEGDPEIEIYADEHRIDQVIVNFVNNAVKYASASSKIYLIYNKIEGFVKISVKDFGPGIPEENLPYLFKRYWRANHLSSKYSGLGLGLYICSEIIHRHDGEIGVESEMGKGSTFWFTIPDVTTNKAIV